MTLQQLKYFMELSTTLHYTKAAENLHIAQPSLSYSIKQLEDELGIPLFRKEGKKIHLTEYGKAFWVYVDRILRIADEAVEHIQEMKNPNKGNINLGYVYSAGTKVVPKIIDSFHNYQKNTNISFILKIGNSPDLIKNILDESIDIAVLPLLNDAIPGISCIPILDQELFFITHKGHRFYDNEFIKLTDLKDEKIVTLDKESELYKRTKMLFKNANLIPKFQYDVDELNSMAAFISEGMGIGISPKIPALESYGVKAIPFQEKLMRKLYLAWNGNTEYPPAVYSFISYVKNNEFY